LKEIVKLYYFFYSAIPLFDYVIVEEMSLKGKNDDLSGVIEIFFLKAIPGLKRPFAAHV